MVLKEYNVVCEICEIVKMGRLIKMEKLLIVVVILVGIIATNINANIVEEDTVNNEVVATP
jgi:hypothetical protein